MTTTVLLAGATGMLGRSIATHLVARDDTVVRLLVRDPSAVDGDKATALDDLIGRSAEVVAGDVTDPDSLDAATRGVDVVISALQGHADIIVDGQIALAESAVRNGVRRFFPSDYAIDLFAAPAGAPQVRCPQAGRHRDRSDADAGRTRTQRRIHGPDARPTVARDR